MASDNLSRILVVGPLPPPINGTGVSFRLFCDEVRRQPNMPDIEIIDSSPGKLKQKSSLTSASNYAQMWRILSKFVRKVPTVDQVLIFGSEGFLLLMAPLLLAVAKVAGKPCYVRAFGGSLDSYCDNLPPFARRYLLFALRHANGLLVQTEWLYERFTALIGDSVFLVPGYRPLGTAMHRGPESSPNSTDELRLIFLGIVKEKKGIFVLLESLRRIHATGARAIHCDIFGVISEPNAARFETDLARTPGATYGGVLEPDVVISTLQTYDALVLPTFYDGEGHPGVLIEAMMAGVPVITTAHRSIPELIDDRVNGLLVAPRDVDSLVEALETIDDDRQLLARMGENNWERRARYDACKVVPLLLQPLGLDVQPTPSPLTEVG